jgi:hypothetical protein
MGATAALGFVTMLATQDTARQSDQHMLGADRYYAHVGPRVTILGGSSGLGELDPLNTRTQLWFRDGQFLFTYSPFTKE